MRLDEYCRAVGRDCKLTTTDRVVMWTMSTYVNRVTGETFVSLATIAADVCLDVRGVRRAVRRLELHGVISSTPRIGQSTIYRFPLHPALTVTPGKNTRGQVSTTPGADDRGTYPQPRAFVAHTPGNTCSNPGCIRPPNHVGNHVKEPRAATLNGNAKHRAVASVEDSLRPFAQIGGQL